MHCRKSLLHTVVYVLLAGCSAGTPATPSPTPTTRAAATSSVPVTPPASTPATTAPPGPPPPAAARLVKVAEHDVAIRLMASEGRVFVLADGPTGSMQMAVVGGDDLRFDPALQVDQVDAASIVVEGLVGAYPGDLALVDSENGGPLPFLHHRVLKEGRWTVRAMRHLATVVGVASGHAGSVAMLRRGGGGMPLEGPPELWLLSSSSPTLPFTPADCPAGAPQDGWLVPKAFGVTGDGAYLSYGLHCANEPAVEWWPRGEVGPRTVVLPAAAGWSEHASWFAAVLPAAEGAWVVGQGIWRLRGDVWEAIPAPVEQASPSGVAAHGDDLWLLTGDGMFTLRDGRWATLPTARGEVPESIAVDGEGRVWLASGPRLLRLER